MRSSQRQLQSDRVEMLAGAASREVCSAELNVRLNVRAAVVVVRTCECTWE